MADFGGEPPGVFQRPSAKGEEAGQAIFWCIAVITELRK